jgi:hypothetical protein
MKEIEEALKDKNCGNWSSPVPDYVIENSEKRSRLWAKLIEKYPKDEELRNLGLEEMSTKNTWFEKYGISLQ